MNFILGIMKATWKEWRSGELAIWHGISHSGCTDWRISSTGTLDTELVLRVHLPTALMDTKVGFRILNTCEYVSCGIQVDPWCWGWLCLSWVGDACQNQGPFLVIATMEVILAPKSIDGLSWSTRACLGSGPKQGLKDNTQTERVLTGKEEACCRSFKFL